MMQLEYVGLAVLAVCLIATILYRILAGERRQGQLERGSKAHWERFKDPLNRLVDQVHYLLHAINFKLPRSCYAHLATIQQLTKSQRNIPSQLEAAIPHLEAQHAAFWKQIPSLAPLSTYSFPDLLDLPFDELMDLLGKPAMAWLTERFPRHENLRQLAWELLVALDDSPRDRPARLVLLLALDAFAHFMYANAPAPASAPQTKLPPFSLGWFAEQYDRRDARPQDE